MPTEQKIEYEAGIHHIPQPLVYGNQAGFLLRGQAAAQLTSNSTRGPQATILAWTGDEKGPIVHLQGSEAVVEHLSIYGTDINRLRTGDWKRPDVAMFVDRVAEGLATGRHNVHNVNLGYAKVGLQIGNDPDEAQCAEADWEAMWFDNCTDAAIRIIPGQAIGHSFKMLRANDCPTILDIMGGGKFLVDGMFTATKNCTLVRLRPQTYLKNGDKHVTIGHNVAAYEFRHIFLDSQAENAVICDMDDWDYAGGRVVFNGGTLPTRVGTGPRFKLAGNAAVTVRDYQYLREGAFVWGNTKHTTRLLLENSCITDYWPELFNLDGSRGSLRVKLRLCYNMYGEDIKDTTRVFKGRK